MCVRGPDLVERNAEGLRHIPSASHDPGALAAASTATVAFENPSCMLPRAESATGPADARSERHLEANAAARPDATLRAAARSPFRHWLAAVNIALAAFVAGALAAPLFAVLGWRAPSDALYAAYHFACHQWAFRSFFLFAPGQPPLAVYSQQQLAALGTDPFSFIGSPSLGWKMAFCERDLAIYIALLAAGLYYARRRDLRPASFVVYGILIVPMALDGFTQLFGWRESTWQLRVVTGLLFGLASGWLVLPRLDASFGLQRASRRYAPETSCNPVPPQEPRPQLSPRG
jgi:uncharacterized membrane protein